MQLRKRRINIKCNDLEVGNKGKTALHVKFGITTRCARLRNVQPDNRIIIDAQ